MKRSKDRPPSTILNFWPVPSASTGARPARPTSNLYADGMVAECCYGIIGEAERQGGRSRIIAPWLQCAVALFCVSSVPRLQGRRRELRHSRIGGSLTLGDLVAVVPCVQSQSRASTKSMPNRLPRRHKADAYCQAACIGRQIHSGFDPLLLQYPGSPRRDPTASCPQSLAGPLHLCFV